MGLLLALRALDIKVNDQVITVANSDIPTSHAITLVGADINGLTNEKTFNLMKICEKIYQKNKSNFACSSFKIANSKKIKLSSQKYNLKIVRILFDTGAGLKIRRLEALRT